MPCGKGIAGCTEHGGGRRGWTVVQKGAESLSEITDARGAAFLDMDEDVSAVLSFSLAILIRHGREP
jgi:integrin alpha FG-GAP repeat containing protein 1